MVSAWEGLSGYTLFSLFPKIFCIVLHEGASYLVIPRSQRANIQCSCTVIWSQFVTVVRAGMFIKEICRKKNANCEIYHSPHPFEMSSLVALVYNMG